MECRVRSSLVTAHVPVRSSPLLPRTASTGFHYSMINVIPWFVYCMMKDVPFATPILISQAPCFRLCANTMDGRMRFCHLASRLQKTTRGPRLTVSSRVGVTFLPCPRWLSVSLGMIASVICAIEHPFQHGDDARIHSLCAVLGWQSGNVSK